MSINPMVDAPDPNLIGNTAPQPDVSNAYSARLAPHPNSPMAGGNTGGNTSGDQNAPNDSNPLAAHHAMLGGALKNIAQTLEGNSTSYVPDPITGEVKEVQVPRKPGAFFRDLLLGAAMGGAASASLPRGSGATAGFTTGLAAQMQNQKGLEQQQKEEAFGQAQRAKGENDKQQAKQEAQASQQKLAEQTVAAHTHGMLVHDLDATMNTPEQLNSYSDASQVLLDKIGNRAIGVDLTANGKNINGVRGNGRQLFDMIQKNPQLMQSAQPDIFHRVDLLTYDKKAMANDGVKKVGTDQWVGKDGKPVNIEDYAVHNIRDIPNAMWGEQLDMPNKDWNTVARNKIMNGADGDISHGTIGQAFAANTRANSQANTDLAEEHRPAAKKEEADSWVNLYKDLQRRQTAGEKISDQEMADAKNKYDKAQVFYQTQQEQEDAKPVKPGPVNNAQEADMAAARAATEYQHNPSAANKQKMDDAKSLADVANKAEIDRKVNLKRRELLLDKDLNPGTADIAQKAGITANDSPDEVIQKAAPKFEAVLKGIRDYEMDPKIFAQRLYKGQNGSLDRPTALNIVKMSDPNWDETQYASRFKMRQDYTAGKQGTTGGNLKAINTAVAHLDRLNTNAIALHNTRFEDVNALKNWALRKTGSAKPGNFMTDANAVAGELSNIFKQSGATDDEINSWRARLSPNMSPEQFRGFVNEGMHLMAGRLKTIAGAWEMGMKRPMNFGLINNETRNLLRDLPGGQTVLDSMNITGGGASGNYPESKSSSPTQNPTPPQSKIPVGSISPGTVMDGFRFKGGKENEPSNWEPVKQ